MAVSKLPAGGGYTVCLTHGADATYVGKYTFTKGGSTANYVRSCDATGSAAVIHPGQSGWAKIDGNVSSTLAVALPTAAPFAQATIVTAAGAKFSEGASVWLEGATANRELVVLRGKQNDGITWNNCSRGWGGTTAGAHSIGTAMYSPDNVLTVSALNMVLKDFEILDSSTNRVYLFNFGDTTLRIRSTGLVVENTTGVKDINLVIHDTEVGRYANESAIGLEDYGTIVFNNGFVDQSRGHGQGFYTANDPATGQKKSRNVISFNGFSDGMKTYTSSGKASNFLIEDYMAFNNGVSATFPGNPVGLPSTYRAVGFFAGANGQNKATNDIKLHRLYFYEPLNTTGDPTLWAGYFEGVGSTGMEVIDSRIMGGANPFTFTAKTGTVTGNTFWAQAPGTTSSNGKLLVAARLDSGYSATWNNNIYWNQTPNDPQAGGPLPFLFSSAGAFKLSCIGAAQMMWAEPPPGCALPRGTWPATTGFDANSTYTNSAPTGTEVFVVKNEYDPTSAHVAIYNWGSASSVNVPVGSFLSNGDSWVAYAAENYLGASIASGTVSGGVVSIPTTGTTVATPIGLGWVAPTTRPQFGVFIVRKL